jgi:SAM-dependent methyltransferase
MVAEITDKPLLRRRLARAHRRAAVGAGFLLDQAVEEIADRLASIDRAFPVAVAQGGQTRALADMLFRSGKVERVFRLEPTAAALAGPLPGFVADEEALPLAPGSIDLFVSTLALQWTNDLPGALVQIRTALRPGGLLLAAMTGGATLAELREALAAAESELSGGISPRVIPAAELADLSGLLQRAGYAMPVADRDALTVRYDSAFDLFRDLRAMGAANASPERLRRPTQRALFLRAAEIYAERNSDPDGRVRATFELAYLTGWTQETEPGTAR